MTYNTHEIEYKWQPIIDELDTKLDEIADDLDAWKSGVVAEAEAQGVETEGTIDDAEAEEESYLQLFADEYLAKSTADNEDRLAELAEQAEDFEVEKTTFVGELKKMIKFHQDAQKASSHHGYAPNPYAFNPYHYAQTESVGG